MKNEEKKLFKTEAGPWIRWKEGEGISGKTGMNDPWTQTPEWGLTEGGRGGLCGGGQRGKKLEQL